MHVTMLVSGLLFFWTLFDPRPAPACAPFSTRLVMAGAVIFANIPLGAVITLKTDVVYLAYEHLGRWWGVAALQDELLGGLVIWIAASMMGLVAVLLLVRLWGRSEQRVDLRRQRGFALSAGDDARMSGRQGAAAGAARRRFGWALGLIPVAVFAGVITLAATLRRHPAALKEQAARAIEHAEVGVRPTSAQPAPPLVSAAP